MFQPTVLPHVTDEELKEEKERYREMQRRNIMMGVSTREFLLDLITLGVEPHKIQKLKEVIDRELHHE